MYVEEVHEQSSLFEGQDRGEGGLMDDFARVRRSFSTSHMVHHFSM